MDPSIIPVMGSQAMRCFDSFVIVAVASLHGGVFAQQTASPAPTSSVQNR